MKSALLKAMIIAVLVASLVVPVAAKTSTGAANVPDVSAGAGTYIIRLVDAPLATYKGGTAGLEATSPRATGALKLDVNTPESVAYAEYLAQKQAAFISAMGQTLGREAEVLFQYYVVYNGMAVNLAGQEAAAVAAMPGVADVQADVVRYPTTDYGPEWIGAGGIWDGSDTGGLPGTYGEGVIVGILDTGQNLDHPSFADIGGDGYDHNNPLGAGNYLGLCDSDPGTYLCNDKFIGYYIYTGENHEDEDGHGSHTGSTVAGNVLNAGTVDLTPYPYSPAISGVAPHANVIGYDVCSDTGGCPGAGSIAATDQAAIDGVDVINFSIGGGTSNPWTDSGSLAFLNASEAGLIPVTSAGNSGPGASTIGSPGDAPWMLTVGASTHNRAGLNALVSMSGGGSPPADIQGKGFSAGHGPAAIVYAGDFGDAQCLTPFTPGTWTNDEIVVCDRGTIARVEKGYNVLQGGAGGYILANATAGDSLNGDVHHLPAVQITYDDGVILKAWLASGSGHTATIEGTTISVDPGNADIMAGFSSRGPIINNTANDIVKPDVTAPGVDVLAAYRSNPPDPENPTSEYGVVSGTSMSSPHTAGAAALMRALYPTWSPAEVKSALMSTGTTAGVVKEDGATPADPFDIGGGRVDLSQAGHPGLILDETVADFTAANPALGGDPKELNLASMGEDVCAGTCTWTRDVTGVVNTSWTASVEVPAGMNLTVTPSTFDLVAGGTQTIEVAADVNALPNGTWAFATVILTPDSPNTPAAHFPVAVNPSEGPPIIAVDPDSLSSTQFPDTTVAEPLTIYNNGGNPLDWEIYEDAGPAGNPELVDWYDSWDSYPTGQLMHGVGGWKGWGNDPAAAAYTTDAYAISAPNSLVTVELQDQVHEYDIEDGLWTYTAWQYIPGDMTGEHYFILLNQYDDAGATNNWSTQVNFSGDAGLVLPEGIGSGLSLPLITDQWVELRVRINLVSDWQEFYYDGQLLYEGSWAEGVSGGGITSIAAVDLWSNGATAVYYDDLSLVATAPYACELPSDIPWASVSPDMGSTPGGSSSLVDVTFDSTGLADGLYEANLCVASNDTSNPILPVPLALLVSSAAVAIDPADQSATGAPGEDVTHTYTVTNDGLAPDTYALAVAGNLWDTSVVATTGELNPGASIEVDVVVTIPTDITTAVVPVGSDSFTLTVMSGLNPAVTAEATGTTNAEATPAVSVGDDQAGSGMPETDVDYTFSVTNMGDYADAFALTLSGETWTSTLSTNTVALGPGESQDVTLTVEIPTGIADGDDDSVTLTATSGLDPAVSDSATATTTGVVEDDVFAVYLPLISKGD